MDFWVGLYLQMPCLLGLFLLLPFCILSSHISWRHCSISNGPIFEISGLFLASFIAALCQVLKVNLKYGSILSKTFCSASVSAFLDFHFILFSSFGPNNWFSFNLKNSSLGLYSRILLSYTIFSWSYLSCLFVCWVLWRLFSQSPLQRVKGHFLHVLPLYTTKVGVGASPWSARCAQHPFLLWGLQRKNQWPSKGNSHWEITPFTVNGTLISLRD